MRRLITSVLFVGAVLAATTVASATPWFHDAGAKVRGTAEPRAIARMPVNYGYTYRAPAPVAAPRPTVVPTTPAPTAVAATPNARRSFSYNPAPPVVTRTPGTNGYRHGTWRADTKALGHSTF